MNATEFIEENYRQTNGGEYYICKETGQVAGAEDIAEAYHQTKLKTDFIKYLKDNRFQLKTNNPEYRPGEGYGPPKYIDWSIDRVMLDFLKENEV